MCISKILAILTVRRPDLGVVSYQEAREIEKRFDVFSYVVLLATAAIIGFVWWQTLTRIDREEHLAVNAAQGGNRNSAYLVAGYFTHSFNHLEKLSILAEALLTGKNDSLPQWPAGLPTDPGLLGVVALDKSNAIPLVSGNAADANQLRTAREFLKTRVDFNRLIVMQEFSNDRQLVLLLPIFQGQFERKLIGALLVNVDLEYFFKLFKDLELGERGELSIFSTEGVELMRSRHDGLMVPRRSLAAAYRLSGGVRESNQFEATDDESARRFYAIAKIADGALFVAVSRPQGEVVDINLAARNRYLMWAATVSLLAGLSATMLMKLMRRQSGMLCALTKTKDENQQLIRQIEDEKTRAYHLAYYDQLTGLANRNFFRAMSLDRLVGSRRRRKASAIFFIDLDRFKAVNDTYGHRVGDQLLIEVAQRLTEALRESDLVSRFGGDEFVIQVDDLDTMTQLDVLAAKVIEVVAAPFKLGECVVEVLPSIGIAVCPQDGDSIDVLIKNADAAMYEAKRSGRGEYRFFDAQLNAKAQRYLNLEQRLKNAIADGEFFVHYQPRISAFGYRIVSLEALARWHHPEYGVVYPGDFIPLAEETGHIVELGAAILHLVCRQVAKWRGAGLYTPSVAVNVSARQLRDSGFVQLVRDAVEGAGISYHDIEIEVTESCVMEDPEMSAAILGALVELGVRISLDDYGTGYSSLSSIKRLPLYAIKIDRSFIADIGIDSNDDVIVASTISMSHGLGLRVVAEGVETREQLKRLRILGCEELQGYLFSRPLPLVEIEKLLQRGICEPLAIE